MTDERPIELLALALGSPNEAARVASLGAIFAPSVDPRLALFDVGRLDTARPFARPVPAASHGRVSVLELAEGAGDWRVAAAMVVLDVADAGLPASWAPATLDDGAEHVEIDDSLAAVTDAAGARHIRRDPALRAQVLKAVEGPAGCSFFDDGEAACDLAWFRADEGGGSYPAWWGLNKEGEPIWLMVDFDPATG